MTDLLQRLHGAIPRMSEWISQTVSANAAIAKPVQDLGFRRLSTYYPHELLESAQVVVLSTIPRPPVAELGLPEFSPFATMDFGGITYSNTFFVHDGQLTESLCAHELVHVVQWRTLGVNDFLLTYGLGLIQQGYEQSPLEAIAFAIQGLFEGGNALPNLLDKITKHAVNVRANAAATFAAYGLAMGA